MNYHIDILSETAAVIPYTVSSAASKIITYGNVAGETVLEGGTMIVRGSGSISNTTVSGGGIGDFNHDGTDDVALRFSNDNEVYAWIVENGTCKDAIRIA